MVCHCGVSLHLHLRGRVCVVMGSPLLVGAQWDLPNRDSLSCLECHCICQHVVHILRGANFLDYALPYEVRLVHLLWLLCVGDDIVRILDAT